MKKVALTAALADYDHVRDLALGRVQPDGIDLTCLTLPIEEIFFRFIVYREWEISEISLAKYVALMAQGDESYWALPVFPSRVFRHSSIYVRSDGPVGPRFPSGERSEREEPRGEAPHGRSPDPPGR